MLPRRAYLGAELPGDAEAFVDGGVKLVDVAQGGMAETAGLRGGDLVLAIAGTPVTDLCTLSAALRRAGATPHTEIVYRRDGRQETATTGVIPQPMEADASYDELVVDGARLRTITTRAKESRGTIAVIQGIACESIDHALTSDAPLAGLIAGWTAAGFDTFRFDKRGVGDSEGEPCRQIDFRTELEDARRALDAARGDRPLFVFGHSVGGIIAAVLAPDVAGIMVYGTPVMRWLACLKDSVGRQLALRGAPADDIAREVARLDQLASTGELNGRSAAYHQQLDELDLEAAWRAITTPTLVVRGEYDWVVRDDDQARIARLCRGPTTIVDLPHLDHLFGKHADRAASLRDYGIGTFDPSIVHATVEWLVART